MNNALLLSFSYVWNLRVFIAHVLESATVDIWVNMITNELCINYGRDCSRIRFKLSKFKTE